MKVLITTFIIIMTTFFIQVLLWKIKIPKFQVKTILVLYMVSLCIFITAINFIKFLPVTYTVFENIYISFFYLVLLAVYIVAFPAIEVNSPSVLIISILKDHKEGMTKNIIYKLLDDDLLVIPRIMDLKRDSLANISNDRIMITRKGKLLLRFILFFRNLLKLDQFGG